jgi:hypothetical protein
MIQRRRPLLAAAAFMAASLPLGAAAQVSGGIAGGF